MAALNLVSFPHNKQSILNIAQMPDPQPTLGFVLNDVARFLRRRFEQNARASGLELTRAQWQALAWLSRGEGLQQNQLADQLEVEPITLARLLDRLQAQGLIERRRHPTDRRAWQLFLTPAAHPIVARMHEIGDRTRQEALAGLGDEERAVLLRSLSLMRKNLIAACERPPEAVPSEDRDPENTTLRRRA